MKITSSAAARAKPISWVTMIMVMPSLASIIITSSTSLIISGSSALVGSSNSINCGSIASARAMAARCCCPPEICQRDTYPLCPRYRLFPAAAWRSLPLSFLSTFFTTRKARVIFSMMERCEYRLKLWNTIPISARCVLRFLLFVAIRMTIEPNLTFGRCFQVVDAAQQG